MTAPAHPRDRFITVYGRKPVLEALRDPRVTVDKLLIDRAARGDTLAEIRSAAAARGVQPRSADAREVTRVSRNGRQDQGVVADVAAPRMEALDAYLARTRSEPETQSARTLLLLDGLTNAANIGLILRAATGAGVDGIILPRAGSPEVGPLMIKASAGVAFIAPILRAPNATDAAAALAEDGWTLYGLRAEEAEDLFTAHLAPRAVFVLGNETHGVSAGVSERLSGNLKIPMASGVESLNVATAAAVVVFERARRRRS